MRTLRRADRWVRSRGAGVRDERGSAMLFVLGLCVSALFLGGLSVDFWRAIAARRSLAAMADAGALAGASALDPQALRSGASRIDSTAARQRVVDELAHESQAHRIATVQIDANAQRVVVTLTQHVDFSLLGLFGDHQGFTVRVSATADPQRRD